MKEMKETNPTHLTKSSILLTKNVNQDFDLESELCLFSLTHHRYVNTLTTDIAFGSVSVYRIDELIIGLAAHPCPLLYSGN